MHYHSRAAEVSPLPPQILKLLAIFPLSSGLPAVLLRHLFIFNAHEGGGLSFSGNLPAAASHSVIFWWLFVQCRCPPLSVCIGRNCASVSSGCTTYNSGSQPNMCPTCRFPSHSYIRRCTSPSMEYTTILYSLNIFSTVFIRI